jgi:hypothetical protein
MSTASTASEDEEDNGSDDEDTDFEEDDSDDDGGEPADAIMQQVLHRVLPEALSVFEAESI